MALIIPESIPISASLSIAALSVKLPLIIANPVYASPAYISPAIAP